MGAYRNPRSTPNPFCDYSVTVISAVCGISISTAYNYKSGRRKPPISAQRLFRLYTHGRILGPEWADYKSHQDKFFGPDNHHINAEHIAHLALVCQTLAKMDPEGYQRFLELLG